MKPTTQHRLLAVLGFSLLALGVLDGARAAAASAGASKPNIVVFLADDHGWVDNSVFGTGEVKTPTMARLAKEGMAFPNAFVASPACGPSRASLLSGLMPDRHGAEPNHTEPKPGELTMSMPSRRAATKWRHSARWAMARAT